MPEKLKMIDQSAAEIKRVQMEGLAIKKQFEAGQAEIAEFNLKEEALRRRTNDAANACVATKKEIETLHLVIAGESGRGAG